MHAAREGHPAGAIATAAAATTACWTVRCYAAAAAAVVATAAATADSARYAGASATEAKAAVLGKFARRHGIQICAPTAPGRLRATAAEGFGTAEAGKASRTVDATPGAPIAAKD